MLSKFSDIGAISISFINDFNLTKKRRKRKERETQEEGDTRGNASGRCSLCSITFSYKHANHPQPQFNSIGSILQASGGLERGWKTVAPGLNLDHTLLPFELQMSLHF